MSIKFLRQDAYDALYKDIPNNIKNYVQNKNPWVEEYFLNKGIKLPIIESNIDFPEIDLILGPESFNDAPNAIKFHEKFRGLLKPIQAADRRLWSQMTHLTFYEYMCSRWPVEDKLNDNNSNGTITDRYFLSRGFFRNGISRLFWISELTYDSSLSDPYEYTKYLFSNQDLINQVDGRSLCRNKILLQACLKTLKNNIDLSEGQKRLFFERLCKIGGITVLDALPKDAVSNLCEKVLFDTLNVARIIEGCKVEMQSESGERVMHVEIKNGKACLNKTVLKSKPENLYRLSIGKNIEIAGIKYRIVSIQQPA